MKCIELKSIGWIFDSLIIILFVLVFGGFFTWLWKQQKEEKKVLTENGMKLAKSFPPEIIILCNALFDSKPSGDSYKGQGESGWDESTWFGHVDTGSDDPNIYMLSYSLKTEDIPKIVVGQSIGVSSTEGMVSLIDRFDPQFKNAGVKLLPDSLQPFLSKRKGLMLYCEKMLDPRDVVPSVIFERLNNPDVGTSLAILDGRVALWTSSQSQIRQLFDIGDLVKQVLIQS